MKTRDLPGWGVDPDLLMVRDLPADADVVIEMIDVPRYPCGADNSALVKIYATRYAAYGPWGLPPIIVIAGNEMQVTGAHRLDAARLAGLVKIPALVIQPWWSESTR